MGPIFRKEHLATEQTLESRSAISQMHSHDAVVHLAPVAIPLSPHAGSGLAALGRPRLVHRADGLRVSMVLGHDLLATVAQFFFIPLDRFEKAL